MTNMKRKRSSESLSNSSEDGDVSLPSQSSLKQPAKKRVAKTPNLDKPTRNLTKAFKLSKRFERQKLGRRLKNAPSTESERIRSEISALKHLDASLSAKHHLIKSLVRMKLIPEGAHDSLPKLPEGKHLLNVHARLCKSNPVKGELAKITQALDLNKPSAPQLDDDSSEDEDDGGGVHLAPSLSPSSSINTKVNPQTLFLPSLAQGYISGSDSASEVPATAEATVRKNRRGQRARQALWEKKYGSSAKHLQKKQKREKGRKEDGNQQNRHGVERREKKPPAASRDDGGKLHPSWEAKKAAKEKASRVTEFKGTKIVF
ncbi:hypothetical protein K470DRAFT_260686, partial [Piedraia hortae CBS 480.64]